LGSIVSEHECTIVSVAPVKEGEKLKGRNRERREIKKRRK
jgi:hypothetical protein